MLKKILKGIVAGAVILIIATLIAFLRWQDQQGKRLEANSLVSETAQGPIEYTLSGKGPAVLIVHGTIGGYDQAQIVADMLDTGSHQFLALSRPGYLRTPLSTGDTFEAQADAYAALLDHLGIDKVAVIAVSGGGPSSLQFTLRYPERCWGLVMLAANSDIRAGNQTSSVADKEPPSALVMNAIFSDFTSWVLVSLSELMPRQFLNIGVGKTYTDAVMNDPIRYQSYTDMANSLALLSRRRPGTVNDHIQFIKFTDYPLEDITAPILILQGNKDLDSILTQQHYLDEITLNSTYIEIDGGTHFMGLSHRDILTRLILDFLNAYAP